MDVVIVSGEHVESLAKQWVDRWLRILARSQAFVNRFVEHSMPNRIVTVSVDLEGLGGPTLKITVDDPAVGKLKTVEFALAKGPSLIEDIKREMESAAVDLAKRKR